MLFSTKVQGYTFSNFAKWLRSTLPTLCVRWFSINLHVYHVFSERCARVLNGRLAHAIRLVKLIDGCANINTAPSVYSSENLKMITSLCGVEAVNGVWHLWGTSKGIVIWVNRLTNVHRGAYYKNEETVSHKYIVFKIAVPLAHKTWFTFLKKQYFDYTHRPVCVYPSHLYDSHGLTLAG